MSEKKLTFIIGILVSVFFSTNTLAQNESKLIKTGSAIINMGSATPTVANSLKPYGLIYLLVSDRNVPVFQVINPTKQKDGIDFSHNGKSYGGGSFIVPKEFIRTSVQNLINSWAAQGVLVDYTVSDFTQVNITSYNFAPKWTMDKNTGTIAVGFLNAAGIPASSFSFKNPSELDGCNDMFVLPHADPTWAVHKNLLFWNKDYKGNIWAGCNAVSVLENIFYDSTFAGVTTRLKMNFLSNNGLVLFSNHRRAVAPFNHTNVSDPTAQYMSVTDGSQQNGAETIYLPALGGGWNPSTKIITSSPTHPDITSLSPGPAVNNIYGRAFNDASRGYVCYQASHNINGVQANNIAAQRIFFNFSFSSLREKAIASVSNALSNVPDQMKVGTTYTNFEGTATGNGGPFTYQWLVSIGGTFTTPNAATTSYTPDASITTLTSGVLSCIVTDACGRKSIASKGITIIPPPPTITPSATNIDKTVNGECPVNSITFNVFDDNIDPNVGDKQLDTVRSFSNGTVTFNKTTGSVTYTSAQDFLGTDNGVYTIKYDGISRTGNLKLVVGTASLAPSVTNETITTLGDILTEINVLANDKNNATATDGSVLYIRNITQKPAKGYAYINTNGTISYLSKSTIADATGLDSLKYLACNDIGYCAEGKVNITLTQNTCGANLYRALSNVAAGTLTTTTYLATEDTYISSAAQTTNFSNTTSLILNAKTTATAADKRILMKFNVSALSTSTVVSSATLSLTLSSAFATALLSTPFPATVSRANQSWTEAGATWTNYDGTNAWGSLGAKTAATDFITNTATQTLMSGGSASQLINTTINATVTENVQAWVTTPANNKGFLITSSTSGSKSLTLDVPFYSRTSGASSDRLPSLNVTYEQNPCVSIPTTYKPVTYPDAATTNSDAAITIDVLANDANYYLRPSNTTVTGYTISSVSVPANGTASIVSGKVVYTPNGSFIGSDTLTYTVTDNVNSQTNTATIRVNVKSVPPKINRDLATTPSGTAVTINITTNGSDALANDTDPQGSITVPVFTALPKNGTASISGTNIIYTPSKGFIGKDTLIYQRSGTSSSVCVPVLSDTALVVITMTNRAPVAVNDTIVTFACSPKTVNVKTNDSDPEGTVLTPSIVSNPTNGTAILNASGNYVYTPNTNYVGTDQFTYRVKDGSADSLFSNTATVVITVSGAANINTAPVANPNAETTYIDQEVNTDVLANDVDAEDDPLTISISAAGLLAPSNGTIQLLSNNMIRYKPNAGFKGTDTYEYQICDAHPTCSGTSTLCVKALVTIKVIPFPITAAGTIWNDADGSAAGTFNNIVTNSEFGTNADGAVYVYLIDSTNTILDKAPVDAAGKYLLVNVPINTTKLSIILSEKDLNVDDALSASSMPAGYINSSPGIKSISTSTTNLTGNDFGINRLPLATPFTFATRLNPSALSTIDATKITGTDPDGTIVSIRYVSFPTNISSMVIGSTTYTAANFPSGGVKVAVNTAVQIFPNAGSLTAVIKFVVIDNSTNESVLSADINVPFYVPMTVGSIAGGGTFCGSGIPSTFTSVTDAAGGQSALLYQWQSSTSETFSASITDIAGANSATYTVGSAITASTYFRRKVSTSTTADGSLFSNILSVVINPLPAAPTGLSAISLVAASLTLSATASGAAGVETVDWFDSQSGGTALVTGTSSSNTTLYTTGTLTNSTAFFAGARNITTGCISLARTIVTGTISGTLYPGVIGSDQAGCGTFTPTTFTSVNDASGLGGITYQWQSSTTSKTSEFANVTGTGIATSATYTPTSVSVTTYFRRVASPGSFNSNVVTVTSNPLPAVPTGASLNVGRTGSGKVTLSGTVASGIIMDWYSSTSGNSLLLSGNNTYTTPTIFQTITYYPLARNITTGCISARVPAIATLNTPLVGGTITSVTTSICGSGIPGQLGSADAASAGTGTYNYQWQSSTTSSSTGFTDISGATATTFTPSTAISQTTYYRRSVSTSLDAVVYSNVVTVTILILPNVKITPTSATLVLGTGKTLTASGADTYVWTPSTGLSSTTQGTIVASPSGTTIYTVTGKNTSGGCTNTASVTVTITSNSGSFTAGAIATDQTVCIGSTPAAFTSTISASGGTGTINYQWQRSNDNANFTDISGATSDTYASPAVTLKTFYRRAASTSTNPTLFTNSVSVTPVTPPVISGGISGPCAIQKDSTKTFAVTAAPTATNYVWTIPSGWSGTSTTNSINVKAGSSNGTVSVVPFNGSCAGTAVNYQVQVIDYARVTITGTPVTASGTNNNPIQVKIQLIDVLGNLINCSGGKATLSVCSPNPSGVLSPIIDNNNGTYSSTLTDFANTLTVCGTIAGLPISQTLTVTFTGPQGGIKGNGPILETERPLITFTATAGRAPFTIVYKSAKSSKNDTVTNVTSGVAIPVAFIPSTTLYTLISITDANGEKRANNFNRDTATIIVVAPTIIVTLRADPAKLEPDSSWATRLVLKVKNIGVMYLTNVQVKLNLRDVFPRPVTYVLDSVRVNGSTVRINPGYDGIQSNDLFSRINKPKNSIPSIVTKDPNGSSRAMVYSETTSSGNGFNTMIDNAINELTNKNGIEIFGNEMESSTNDAENEKEHSVYMFGPSSELPVQVEADMFLYVHLKPNGYFEPFVMQAVALGTGSTEGATALANSLSNDNNDISAHPDITKKGDPQPTVVTLIPNPVIGSSLSAGTPALQGNGTYNVLLSLKLKNYGNVNLTALQLFLNLGRMIGLPASFNIVGAITSSNNLVINPTYDGKLDSNLLLPTSQLARTQEGTIQFTINITPNQFSAIYRLQATPSAFNSDINGRVTDLSTDGADPDPDNDKKPIEKLLTIIPINTPIPTLDPGIIGILVNPTPRTTVSNNAYCVPATGIPVVSKVATTGGSGPYQYQWQSSLDNITFNNILNANDSIYTTGNITGKIFLRRQVISDNQMGFSNAVYIELYPVSPLPVITATSNVIVGNGRTTLTSSIASTYTWSTNDTTRNTVINKPGIYSVTITDVYGCPYKSNYTVSLLEPYQVVDLLKTVSKAPELQSDGSFLITFNITAKNLRPDLMDSVKIKDDLSRVFPTSTTFSVIDLKSSGKLISNSLYDGKVQIQLLADVSQLPALKSDSVQLTVKVFPNGFVGTLNNPAELTAKSPYGTFSVTSNDNLANSNPAIRLPAKFIIPDVDIFIPSGFSPNLDGTNDKFVIIRPFNTTINFEVFNRWGNRVFLAPDYKNEWDGKGNQPSSNNLGEDLPDGTYYYIVLASNRTTGAVRKFAGYITLKR